MIRDGNELWTDAKQVTEVMNTYYTTTANSIGLDINATVASNFTNTSDYTKTAVDYSKNHHSVLNIKSSKTMPFSFMHTNTYQQIIKDLNPRSPPDLMISPLKF